jgi:hypothetical protein
MNGEGRLSDAALVVVDRDGFHAWILTRDPASAMARAMIGAAERWSFLACLTTCPQGSPPVPRGTTKQLPVDDVAPSLRGVGACARSALRV